VVMREFREGLEGIGILWQDEPYSVWIDDSMNGILVDGFARNSGKLP